MSKKFKSQASSGRVVPGGFGAFAGPDSHSSTLSYIQEPPDYTTISDANVVVAFKNLSKKDSTTKAKALEDIQAYIALPEHEAPEEGLLEAWVKLYPRLSIDSARRVRQLAHALNGNICSKCGKRSARQLPKIVGPWLAGSYDSDRAAAKTAQDALRLVFASPEKVVGLKKTFQGAIVEYCRDAILHETVKTLSDERAVSSDDAEATYARVLATSLAVVANLLSELAVDEIGRQRQVYEQLFGDSKFWDLAAFPDAAVRRSMHRLLQAALRKEPDLVEHNLKGASTAYIYKGLPSDQTGSTVDYVTTLDALSARHPSVWTDSYTGKKPAVSRLKQFLKHGSRSGPPQFWEAASSLFGRIPPVVLPQMYEEAKDLVFAARDGVASKEERFNASAAWPAYYKLLAIVLKELSREDQDELLESCAIPPIKQYLQPTPESAEWTIHGGRTAPLIAEAARLPEMDALLEREWPAVAEKLIEMAKLSQPQQSKDFEKSQASVASAGQRYAALQRELFSTEVSASLSDVIFVSNTKVVNECAQLLKSREGKPYGAAAIVEELLRQCGPHLMNGSSFRSAIDDLLRANDYQWVAWPSFGYVVRCLYATKGEQAFPDTFKGCLDKVLHASDSEEVAGRVRALFPRNVPEEVVRLAKDHTELQELAVKAAAPEANQASRDMLLELCAVAVLSVETRNVAFSTLIKSLADVDDVATLSSTLEMFVAMDNKTLKSLVSTPEGDQLLPNLLRLESHEDESLAHKAAAVSSRLSATTAGQTAAEGRFSIVRQNLENVSSRSLSVDAVHDLTNRLLGEERKVSNAGDVLPDLGVWRSSLKAVIRPPKPSLAVLSPLGGAIHLVEALAERSTVHADAEGLSQALRIAMYVTRLLAETDLTLKLDETDQKWAVIALLYVTSLLAEDNICVLGTNALWHPTAGAGAEVAVLDMISETNAVLSQYWERLRPEIGPDGAESDYTRLIAALEELQDPETVQAPANYYVALAYARITSNLFELHGHTNEQSSFSEQILKSELHKDTMTTIRCVVGLQQPLSGTAALGRLCNELVSSLTAMENVETSVGDLLKLNVVLQSEEALAAIAKQRLIFLVKRLIPAMATMDQVVKAELCKSLTLLLPRMEDMYGEHWSQVLQYLMSFWTSEEGQNDDTNDGHILLLNASLKLYATLRKLSRSEDPNDDLLDALKDSKDSIYQGFISLLKSANGSSDESHQPLLITHELLARQIGQLPYQPLQDVDELYPLLYTQSRPIQQGAFDLLHKYIPATQEQISFDAALENKTAQLPDELLSLILEAPTLDSLVDAPFDRTMPLTLQGYLYSWRLLFDHFTNSSYRVKSDYIEQLKDGSYLSGLLSFTFDFLGHSRGKPIDASKFDIREYMPDTEPSPERDVQWLLTHLYYLALTHLPSSVKSYYLDIRSRQTSLAVENWTAKYISPLIVDASLHSVAEWSEKSVKEDPEYEKMAVKVGMRSKEINVSYVVDEQTMAIKVVLPEAYPLASAQVVGVSRVAVKEEKWQSWLRNCQGVITFSNGSITDGLSAWRKNVTGALKGQTECAICYSIIDSQKQLPTKRCPTCKNLFHSSCLFKWFKTSNASTCPLCRNAFNFN